MRKMGEGQGRKPFQKTGKLKELSNRNFVKHICMGKISQWIKAHSVFILIPKTTPQKLWKKQRIHSPKLRAELYTICDIGGPMFTHTHTLHEERITEKVNACTCDE